MVADRGGSAFALILPAGVGVLVAISFFTMEFADTTLIPRRPTAEEIEDAKRVANNDAGVTLPGPARMYLHQISEGKPVIPDRELVNPQPTYMLLYIVVIVVMWFACASAAKEVVKEQRVYDQERLIGLKVGPYLASKFVVLWLLGLVQAGLFLACLFGVLSANGKQLSEEYTLPLYLQFLVLAVMSAACISIGLLISCWTTSTDQATMVTTYYQVSQLILGGGIVVVTGTILAPIAWLFSPPFWANRALTRGGEVLTEGNAGLQVSTTAVWISCGAIVLQTIVAFVVACWVLSRKRGQRR
jgi:hypothetical protein